MNVVEVELLSIWATVFKERQKDSLILIYSDFLNEVLQGQTHLYFYIQCNKIIMQMLNGDEKDRLDSSKGKKHVHSNLNCYTAGHIKIERVIEIV